MRNNSDSMASSRVCLVTEELSGIGGSGGIGAAFFELAKLLVNSSFQVDVLYCPVDGLLSDNDKDKISRDFLNSGIKLTFLDYSKYVEMPITYEKKSYAISRYLSDLVVGYSFIHFHDYKGLGFFSTSLKRQGLAFRDSQIVVQLHGPTRWTIEENGAFFVHEDQLKIDFMERMSIAQADAVVSPSHYLVDWLKSHEYSLPENVNVIKNVCSDLSDSLGAFRQRRLNSSGNEPAVTDVICFARHEDRKGFSIFCDALDLINDELAEKRITITFLGKFGMVGSQPSGIYLIERAKKWKFSIKTRSGFARNDAASYIVTRKSPLVVIPSPAENSPYTVLESIVLGVPVVSSLGGGGSELFDNINYSGLCDIGARQIADKILLAVNGGVSIPVPSETPAEIERNWLGFHNDFDFNVATNNGCIDKPKVTFAITHYERPEKLFDAIISAVRQTYKNIEIVVVDDGSSSDSTVSALKEVENLLERVNGKLIRQENSYLGAARNTAVRAASGEYICFLDDDDIAKPELIETLVTAAVSGGYDVVNCMNIFMNESRRGDVLGRTEDIPKKVSYVPLGGPVSLAPTENCLGAATALFKKTSLIEIGGYSEIKGVGHEDYELFIRFAQADKKITIVPVPLYYYEVGRPSMLSRTSMAANFRRCFDALDVSMQPAAMKDIISLAVGKSVAVNSHNRQHWIYSLTSTGAIKNRVLTQSLNRHDMLNALIELASEEKSLKMRLAYEEDLSVMQNIINDSDDDSFENIFQVEEVADNSPKNFKLESDLINMQLDMALGRYSVVADEFCFYVNKNNYLTDPLLVIVRELLSVAEGVSKEQWMRVFVAMRSAKYPKKVHIDALTSILFVAIRAGATDFASGVFPAVIGAQDCQYVNAYPDVADALVNGDFNSGLDHYLSFGFKEGRDGFFALRKVCDYLNQSPESDSLAEVLFSGLKQSKKIIDLLGDGLGVV